MLATDAAPTSLALATANAALNGLSDQVEVRRLDWHSDEDIQQAVRANGGPFDVVLGSALQFERWESRLWPLLAALTHSGVHGQRSIIALAHTTGAIPAPSAAELTEGGGRFEEIERVSGLAFGLRTRWNESESDFEVVLLERSGVQA